MEILGVSEIDKTSSALVTIFEFIGETPALLTESMSREIKKTVDPNTLFRSNSMASRMMTLYSRRIGESYLNEVIRPVVEKILSLDNSSFEIDISKLAATETVEKNLRNLLDSTLDLINAVTESTEKFPM